MHNDAKPCKIKPFTTPPPMVSRSRTRKQVLYCNIYTYIHTYIYIICMQKKLPVGSFQTQNRFLSLGSAPLLGKPFMAQSFFSASAFHTVYPDCQSDKTKHHQTSPHIIKHQLDHAPICSILQIQSNTRSASSPRCQPAYAHGIQHHKLANPTGKAPVLVSCTSRLPK